MKRYALTGLLLSALLLGGCGAAEEPASGVPLEVYCFAAGSADAFLLTTADGAALIDTGERGFGQDILAYLEEKGIERLDALIITHFDKDHVGGAAKVLNNFPVDLVLQSSRPKDSSEYERYVKALESAGLEPMTVRETYEFTLGGVRFVVDPPQRESYNSDSSNNSSLIVSVYNGNNCLLFMGDAQTERIGEFLASNRTTCDVLKVPHHGRDEPLMEKLLESVQPKSAVITSSDDEPESAETVALLEQAGAEVFLTRLGAVVIRCDGTELEISYE